MRKIFTLTIAGIALLALAVAPAIAAENVTGDKACTAHGANAKMISADAKTCPHASTTGAKMSAEECAKQCGYTGGKCDMVNMSIKGMTCGGCEGTITTALMTVPGVVKVVSISYKDGSALVCVDPVKVKHEAMTTAVSNKGYEAEIVPAVATMPAEHMVDSKAKECCAGKAKTCSAAEKAACAKKEASADKIEGTEKSADDTK